MFLCWGGCTVIPRAWTSYLSAVDDAMICLLASPATIATEALVEPHLDHILGGNLRALNEANGAAGRCWDASREIIQRVGRGDLFWINFLFRASCLNPPKPILLDECEVAPGWIDVYGWGPHSCDICHVVAVIDGVIVDLTARQFDRRLPFPMVIDARPGREE